MSESPFSLEDQVVLVSGAGRGIGRAAAELMAQMGARVALTARTASQIEEVASEIRADGGDAFAFRADVAAVADHDNLIEDVEETCGPITGLVNVAGISPILQRAERVTLEQYDQIMEVNQRGTFFLTRAMASRWIEQERPGAVVNISSGGGDLRPAPPGPLRDDAGCGGGDDAHLGGGVGALVARADPRQLCRPRLHRYAADRTDAVLVPRTGDAAHGDAASGRGRGGSGRGRLPALRRCQLHHRHCRPGHGRLRPLVAGIPPRAERLKRLKRLKRLN